MSKKKKIILSIVALAAAVYAAAWLFLPYGRYKNFQETDCPWETEVSFPGIFFFSGSITMKLNDGASLIFEPGVFSGCDIFIFLRGGGQGLPYRSRQGTYTPLCRQRGMRKVVG